MLQIKAIQFNVQNPFTWASGWKSPIYCDNRILLSYPEVRNFVKNQLTQIVKDNFSTVNCIAGVATAGIPHASLVADILELPLVYVRDKPKGHGMKNTIEGRLPEKPKVVVIEDVISTGKSSLKAVEDLKEAQAEIIGMAAIYTYEFDIAKERFEEHQVKLATITRYSELVKVAAQTGYVSPDNLTTLQDWRKNPAEWSIK